MQRIVMDCRFAAGKTGLGRYTRELVTALLTERALSFQSVLLVHSAAEEWLTPLRHLAEVIVFPVRHYTLREQWLLPRLIRQLRGDLFFSPHFNVPLRCPVPYVMTVHDLILHRYPNQASWFKQWAYRLLLRRAVKRAAAIIAVSAFTAQELQSVLLGAGARVTVIHEGVSPAFHPQAAPELKRVREHYGLQRPYFLYVGNAKQHKNVPFLLQAYRLAHPAADLILIMNGPEADRLTLPAGARRLTEVPEGDLPALYTGARAMVTASLYEGFGLPVVEAEACGCPVIAVNGSSLPEVTSATATLLAPTQEAFVGALQQEHFPAPRPRAWNWQKTAKETSDLLVQALR